jgi:hypothetical protein
MKCWILLLTFIGFSAAADQLESEAVETASPIEHQWGITAAIAVPQPLTIGVERRFDLVENMSYFVEGGWFQYKFGENKSRALKVYSVTSGVRYRPFFDWLTLTGEFGFRRIGLNVDISNLKMEGVSLANAAQMNVSTFFVGLLAGGQWSISENIALAFDLGVQLAVPILHGGEVKIEQSPGQVDGSDLSVDDEETMKRVSSIPLPQIALVRFIWYI